MKFFRFLDFSLIVLLSCLAASALAGDGSIQGSQDPVPGSGGEIKATPPIPVDTFYVCQGDAIYDTLVYQFDNVGDSSISLAIYDGPGELTWEVTDRLYGYYSYVPEGDGNFLVQYLLVGPGADSTVVIYKYVVFVDEPPLYPDQYRSAKFCNSGEARFFRVWANDPEEAPLTFELISGPGELNSVSGWLSYLPDTTGVYTFEVVVYDDCHTDTATMYDSILFNIHPELLTGDTTIYACGPGEICFDIDLFDFEGDPILMSQTGGPGTLTPVDEDTWRQCFEAGAEDSVTYTFYYSVFDECIPYGSELPPSEPQWLTDSLKVTVIYTEPPVIACPEALTFWTCEVDTFCFEVSAEAAVAGDLTFRILSDNATIDGSTVCFVADGAAEFDVVIEVVDACGNADTCTVPISVDANQAPYANLGDGFEVTVCVTETICIDAFAGDADFNLATVTANFGFYDAGTDRFCFEADSAGSYTLILTSTDSCGASASDTTVITVVRPADPQVNLPEDFSVNMCGETTVCFLPEIIADSIASYIIYGPGYLDTLSGEICFEPDTSGVYTLILEVTGECAGAVARDTINVTVLFPPSPFLSLADDFTREMCTPEEICFDVYIVDVYESFELNFGTYDPIGRQICFTPDTSGTYVVIAQVTDSCATSVVDTIQITVGLNNAPVISHLPDTSLYLCYPQEICLDVTVEDPDGDLDTVYVNRGTLIDGQFCFLPFDSGTFDLIVTAIDDCGNVSADTALVSITTDIGIALECPDDTTVFTCSMVDTFCFPIEGIPEGALVEVTGIGTWYDSLNQMVCFWSECSNTNLITVTATTPCDSYTCTFTVTILCNSDPLVILPPDTSISACVATEVCVPVGISDQDGNLAEVISSLGTYDPTSGLVCFIPDTAGVYSLTVTAVDSCDASDSDQMLITILGNSPPSIEVISLDTVYNQCEPVEICLSVEAWDVNGNLDTILAFGGAVYNSETGEVCIMPDGSGSFCGSLIAIDDCGLADSVDFCVTVETGDYVYIDCDIPEPYSFDLCTGQEVCVGLAVSGSGYTIETSYGTWLEGQLCFLADTAGTYNITVIGNAECNSDTCVVPVIVTIAEPVDIVCPGDTVVPVCGVDTVCFEFSATGAYSSISVSAGAYLEGMTVCVPFDEPATKTLTLIASGDCGADTCTFTVTANFNLPPSITATAPDPVNDCELSEICFPVSAFDPDGNLVGVTSSQGVVQGDTLVCFTPEAFGTHLIEVIASDECGEWTADTIEAVIILGGDASILCPDPLTVDTICGPDTICVSAPVSPSNATVTVSPVGSYDPVTGQVCIPVSEDGTIDITMTAEAPCGTAICEFAIEIVAAVTPTVSCPGNIDTVLCFVNPQTLCYPVTITGTDVTVTVEPFGSYDGSSVCLDIDEPGTYEIDIIAVGYCGVDTCHTSVTVTADQEPTLTLPSFQTFIRCLDRTDSICLDGILAGDAESDVSLAMTCGAGAFALTGTASGQVCFLPDTVGVYEFCFEVVDECHTIVGSFEVEVIEEADCDLCIEIWMETDSCTVVGVNMDVKMFIDTREPIGGFDLLLSYDASVMTFNSVTNEGTALEDWEYFTHRLGDGNCGSNCPSGLLRLIGLADMNNGPYHPPAEALTPIGLFVVMNYYVANDQNLGDLFLPINFVWFDCGDNTFSSPSGNDLYVETRIYNPEGLLLWDENDDAAFPELSRPFGVGTPDECIQEIEGKPAPIRCVEFNHGGICVIDPEDIDARGDINLNGVAYEIADAVVLSNYFIYGLSAFTVSVAGQIAASDVNADGLTLSVADLVYLIRVIIGDADPIPKLGPLNENVTVSTAIENNILRVATEAEADIGALYVVYDINENLSIDDVFLGIDAGEMDLMWGIVDGQLKVLVYSFGTEAVDPGRRTLLEIPISGDGTVSLSHVEVVDYQGRPFTVAGKAAAMPSDFTLRQNYPNPFNPTTTISFDLPVRSDWTIEIYSITGSLVREFGGSSESGTMEVEWDGQSRTGDRVASGIYFYRLKAGAFSQTRKMVLLK